MKGQTLLSIVLRFDSAVHARGLVQQWGWAGTVLFRVEKAGQAYQRNGPVPAWSSETRAHF